MRATRRVKPAPARRPARRWLRLGLPSTRALLLSAAALGILAAGGAAYMVRDRVPAVAGEALQIAKSHAVAFSAGLGLSVQEIYVDGRGETPAADILAVLDVSRNAPILAFSPEEARAELEKLPWVRHASIERRLPDTVFVRITERVPLALWQRHGQLAVIDDVGVEIRGANIERYRSLPVVVGEDAPAHAAALIALLDTEPSLRRRVIAAVRAGNRRWNLRLDLGEGRTVEALLPEVNAGAAWTRLAELDRNDRLFDRAIVAVDLRLPDRLVLRVNHETPPAPPATTAPKRGGKTEKKPT
jgi:cell division protein FtsQ